MSKSFISYEDLHKLYLGSSVYNANKVLKAGWYIRGYPVVNIEGEIPWNLENQEFRSWNFHIHSLDMLDSLLKAHSITGEIQFLKPCIKIAIDWAKNHRNIDADVSPFAWYDMAVGIRSYRLAYILDVAAKLKLINENEQTFLWESILQHQSYLAIDDNIAFHNNHGYYQVAGQLAMGRRFLKESSLMEQAYRQGEERLLRMVKQQFTEEGIHREHSPGYHIMVYNTLNAIINSKLVTNVDIISFAKKIESTASWFILPSLHIANIGDTHTRQVHCESTEAKLKWHTPEMRFVVTSGEIGALPEEQFAAFPKGGYFIVRKPSKKSPERFNMFSYLAQTTAFHSRTHKHADDLSFIWYDRGMDILVDSGRYGYIGKTEQGSDLWHGGHWYSDPYRIYCESTRAHNTLEFDDRDYPRKGVKPYGSALGRWLQDQSGMLAVETECRHFKGLRRVRLIFFMPCKWLMVFDWFHDVTGQPHDTKQWFHLAPQLELLMEQGGYVSFLPTSKKPLRVASLLEEPVASRPIIGEEKPQLQGWWSGKERDVVPNYAFCYQTNGVVNGAFATLFSFSETLSTDTQWSKVNVSGRKGQFLWEDEEGTHVLRFERPAEGDMSASYRIR
jgi:hypothetical protein